VPTVGILVPAFCADSARRYVRLLVHSTVLVSPSKWRQTTCIGVTSTTRCLVAGCSLMC
jgi:hypothetical protein